MAKSHEVVIFHRLFRQQHTQPGTYLANVCSSRECQLDERDGTQELAERCLAKRRTRMSMVILSLIVYGRVQWPACIRLGLPRMTSEELREGFFMLRAIV